MVVVLAGARRLDERPQQGECCQCLAETHLITQYSALVAARLAPGQAPVQKRDGLPLVRPVPVDPGARHVYHHYVVRVLGREREALSDHLASLGISTAAYYPFGLHQQTCFEYLGHKDGDFPETESLAQEALALPVYPEMKPEDIDRVVHAVVDFFS